MNRQLLVVVLAASCLTAACGKTSYTTVKGEETKPPLSISLESGTFAPTDEENSSSATAKADDKVDYSQLIKRNWIRTPTSEFPDNGGLSIVISDIKDGKISGEVTALGGGPSYNMDIAEFEGTVNGKTAECQLVNDSRGNKGTISFSFLSPDMLEAAIALTEKTEDIMSLPEGTYKLSPYNLKNIEGFEPVEEQTFMIDLDSWGTVKFVSGKLTAGNHVPVVFYLTDEDDNLLYEFETGFPYRVNVEAVSFQDVNKDNRTDVIIIVSDQDGKPLENPLANVCLQQADGTFKTDYELNQEINQSGNNRDITSVVRFVMNKFNE